VNRAKAARAEELATAYKAYDDMARRVVNAASPAGIESYLTTFNARDRSSIRKSAVYKTIVSRASSLNEAIGCAEWERDQARVARDESAGLLREVVQRFRYSVPLHDIDGMSSWLRS
jgi:hypothetical protein